MSKDSSQFGHISHLAVLNQSSMPVHHRIHHKRPRRLNVCPAPVFSSLLCAYSIAWACGRRSLCKNVVVDASLMPNCSCLSPLASAAASSGGDFARASSLQTLLQDGRPLVRMVSVSWFIRSRGIPCRRPLSDSVHAGILDLCSPEGRARLCGLDRATARFQLFRSRLTGLCDRFLWLVARSLSIVSSVRAVFKLSPDV